MGEAYRERNRVERLVGRLKQDRRVATRHDKLAATFLGFAHLALTVIRLEEIRQHDLLLQP
jgi:transposase